ncbi:MAG TPA: response regulator transcription factor [Solirubrobacteraceae bacterium]|jgi:DNA-binding NarL/FixJ family response regulator
MSTVVCKNGASTRARISAVLGEFGTPMSRGLTAILGEDADIEIIGAALGPALLEQAVAERSPDVALLSGQTAGSRLLVGRLTSLHPALRIVVLANEPSRSYALRLLTYGVAACVSSDATAEDILAAIHMSVEGKQLIACRPASRSVPQLSELSGLTGREAEVLSHLRAGATNAEIASLLHISQETVRSHASSIYRKLDVRGRRDLPRLEE